jgi:heme/copper-type cytochrome/quinol oxidase subunit 3
MSVAVAPRAEAHRTIPDTIDDRRGTWGMVLFIVTEAMLFVLLFFSYAYLGHVARAKWPPEAPKLTLALIMLAVLLTSSVVLHWAERQERAARERLARMGVGGTVFLGVVFVALQVREYAEHLKTLTPRDGAYGSIFYTITSFHGAHVVLGLLMLTYVLILPEIGPAERPPHHALHNASLYWHFVDAVWLIIVGWLYVAPHLGG